METAAGATQRIIHYAMSDIFTAGGVKTVYIDGMKDLSLVNHRLYRQGRVPLVRLSIDAPMTSLTGITMQVLPNTWQVRKAHQLALKEYLRATKEERRRTGQARWHDFKVWLEDGMRTGYTASPLGITAGSAEWPYSQITKDDETTECRYKFIGASDTAAFGMIAEYDSMADTDQDQPNNPASGGTGPYADLHPDVSDKNKDNLLDEGDNPPYNPDALQVQLRTEQIWCGPHDAQSGNKLMTPFVPAPCGLIKLSASTGSGDTTDTVGVVKLEFAMGDYKGIHATPMGLKL